MGANIETARLCLAVFVCDSFAGPFCYDRGYFIGTFRRTGRVIRLVT